MANWNNKVLYVGVTNNLKRRVIEHKNKIKDGFTSKYNINKLVYFNGSSTIRSAIGKEKQIKGWIRERKNKLIEEFNPEWRDLYEDI